MANTLVTGATGFLGKHLVDSLLEKGDSVTILARRSSQLDFFKNKNIKIYYGNITNRLDLLQATEGMDRVYHLAGLIAYKRSERRQMEQVNVGGTANVIDACVTNNVDKLLHLSSVVTIGASYSPQQLNEESVYNLSKYNLGYFETKRKAEHLVIGAHQHNNLQAYMINPSTIYGAGDAIKGSRKTQIKVAKGEFKLYPPGGVNVVYVKDVINAIHLCLEKGKPARRYIISGDNLTIKQLFEIIASVANVKAPNIPIPKFLLGALGFMGDRMRALGMETSLSSETAVTTSLYHWFSNERAVKELGFQPTSAKTAIEESVSWMIENGLLKKS